MKSIQDFNVSNKRVLVRVDFNMPLDEKGQILDDFRIRAVLPTIEYLLKKEAKIILISHFEPKEGKPDTLQPVAQRLEKLVKRKIKFFKDYLDKKNKLKILEIKKGELILLENLRFHKEEKEGDLNFARNLALLGDIFLEEAFSACHRPHASIVGIPKYLPSGAGPLLSQEIKILSRVLSKPIRPLVAIIGGIKIESKIKVIDKFLKVADYVLLSSKIGEEFLLAQGILIHEALEEKKWEKSLRKVQLTSPKIHLPLDVLVSPDESGKLYVRETSLGGVKKGEGIFDIGTETIATFSKIIKEARTIFWSGPLGKYENKKFEAGTKEIAKAIARNFRAFRVAGGGDTLAAIKKFNLENKFDFLSTGGGAMLMFLAGETLPGIEVLE